MNQVTPPTPVAIPKLHEVISLFEADDPQQVWQIALVLAREISPDGDFTLVNTVYQDLLRMFAGEYPGYLPITTPYHDRTHTLAVFLCAMRLLHGLNRNGLAISPALLTAAMIATLFHDIGYSQEEDDLEGTGAKYTREHVGRGIAFMRDYLARRQASEDFLDRVASMMWCTDHNVDPDTLSFADEDTRRIAYAVGNADLVAQMADRGYLEKLVLLFFEFREAGLGDYHSLYDLLCQTTVFYQKARQRLDEKLQGLYRYLAAHFHAAIGVEHNYYLESVEKNMGYLVSITSEGEEACLNALKRGGIVQLTRFVLADDNRPEKPL